MRPSFEYGDQVRVIRNVRNDGTYPGLDIGAPLVKRGSVGHVQNVGTYLQDQVIYSVHFLEDGIMVGCREEELIPAEADWIPTKYEFRDKVAATKALSVGGEVIVEAGACGEVLKVLRDAPGGVAYHVRFPGRTLQVPESALDAVERDPEPGTSAAADGSV